MGYYAKVISDSISPAGVRVSTLEARFPRFILAEMNTHRVFSRNSASSRAIPPEQNITNVTQEPFIPETFGKRVKGMGVGEDIEDQEAAKRAWTWMLDKVVQGSNMLIDLDCDKSRINRVLEPWMWHTAIITSTEWENFFGLRAPDGDTWQRGFPAQPEMQIIAIAMREALWGSEPEQLQEDWWHLPYAKEDELEELCMLRKRVEEYPDTMSFAEDLEQHLEWMQDACSRRLARVSFDKHTDSEPFNVSITKAGELKVNGHFSPFEHVCRPLVTSDLPGYGDHIMLSADNMMAAAAESMKARKKNVDIWQYVDMSKCWSGNLRGFLQYRKTIPHESNHMEVRNGKAALQG